jgi:hypothetical protein
MKVSVSLTLIFAALMPMIHFVSCFWGEFPGVPTLLFDVIMANIMLGLARESWREHRADNKVQRNKR